jgi:hypothetical protein
MNDNYDGLPPGPGDISEDPVLVNGVAGDVHLKQDSPCIDYCFFSGAGDDWELDARVEGLVDVGADELVTYYTEAPDPEPGCDGPLFGGSQTGFPAWVWFSVPLTPAGSADPNALLGFDCGGKLWYWDKCGKYAQVYQPPWVVWNLAAGDSYLLRLTEAVTNPSFEGVSPFLPQALEFKLCRMGWTWVGMPGWNELTGDDFMNSVAVMYPSDNSAAYRTARQDHDKGAGSWISWAWAFYDTYLQAPKAFTPYAPFGNRTCYPWIGYRVWVRVGTATSEDEADQVTLFWPKH